MAVLVRLFNSTEKALAKIGESEAEILLARDATRYAKADQLAYRRLKAAGQEEGIGDFLQRLPKARALQVARGMLKDTNPNMAILASAFLIQAGDVEASIPTLVDLAARGAVEGKTLTGFGWILSHGNSKAQLQEINKAFRAYLNDHMGRYSATEQSRIRRAFGLNLEGRGGVAQ